MRAATPAAPEWDELAAQLPPVSVLGRALMRTLAHSPRGPMTAADLVAVLPPLSVAQSDRPVRRVLRAHQPTAFHSVSRGRWQLGRSALTP